MNSSHFIRVDEWNKLRHVDPCPLTMDRHRQLVAKHLGAGTTQSRQTQVLAHERRSNNVKLFERNHAIDSGFSRQKRQQIDEQRWTSIVWNSD